MDIQTLLLLLCIGLLAGIASGFVGIGGGMIIVPALVFGLGLNQHMAQGTSLAMMIPPIGILAVMSYYKAGQIQLEYAGILALTFVLGAWMGSKWALRINPSVVRLVFGLFMLFAAGRLILKSWNDLNP
ncbi:MAG: sulfite exporter TauE/SafE family protein [Flavobacteriales bacterium]